MSQFLRDLEAERLAKAASYEASEARKADSRRSGRLVMWLGLVPFALAAMGVTIASAHMKGYLQGYEAAKAGKSVQEGLNPLVTNRR